MPRPVALAVSPGPSARLLHVLHRVRLDRAVPVVAVLAAAVLVLVEAPLAAGPYRIAVPLAFALAAVNAGGLPLALRVPNVAAALSLAAALVLQALSAGPAVIWPWWPVLIVAQTLVLVVVAVRLHWAVAALHWLLALGLPLVLVGVLRPAADPAVTADLVVFGAVSGGLMIGAAVGTRWRSLRSELLHERQVAAAESERRAVVEERTRIARELHDVVAHSLSLITVQSSTARFRFGGVDGDAAAEFDRIGAQSRQALDEMRGLLRVLRDPDEERVLQPQPGLADLAALVAQVAETAPHVSLHLPEGEWGRGVGPVTGLAAYRIVQEATSNALRHAPGSPVDVVVERTDDAVAVDVTNAAPPAPGPVGGGGHGLVGMAERAAGAGGSLRFGPTTAGGWSVRAVLPLRAVTGRRP